MKKHFAIAALVLALLAGAVLAGCDADAGGPVAADTAALEVRNESSVTMTDIKWNDTPFSGGADTAFSPGSIFTGTVDREKAENGVGYIFFSKNGLPCRTQAAVSFADSDGVFIFTDNTIAVDTTYPANINTLARIAGRLERPADVNLLPGRGRLSVTWAAVPGADSYRVYCGAGAVQPETPVQTDITRPATVITRLADGTALANGTRYCVWVQAVNSAGPSPVSAMAEGTPVNDFTANSAETFGYALTGISADTEEGSYTISITGSFTVDTIAFAVIGDKTITIRGNGAGRAISNAALTVSAGITLELETITLNAPVLRVETDGVLVLKTGAVITGAATHGVYVDGGTVTMTGGAIRGNATPRNGTGGDINIAKAQECYGAGVYVNSGTFNMGGGEISGNSASYSNYYDFTNEYIVKESCGGGVYVKNGTFVMSGGAISGNSTFTPDGLSTSRAWSYGGGVYVNSGSFTMTGGTISGNAARTDSDWASRGGGVYIAAATDAAAASFSKTGGTIDDSNSADTGKVAYSANGGRRRDTTAGPGISLNSATPDNWE